VLELHLFIIDLRFENFGRHAAQLILRFSRVVNGGESRDWFCQPKLHA